jgi:hypothetical protein
MIATIAKKGLLAWLRHRRDESKSAEEATAYGAVIREIETGRWDS